MKLELEYAHDSNNSKIWIIEQKSKNIIIHFGKKGANLKETRISFSNETEAKDNFKKRVEEKLKKGYQEIKSSKKIIKNISKASNIKSKSKSKNKSKNKSKSKSKTKAKTNNAMSTNLKVQNINPYIDELIKFADLIDRITYDYYEKYDDNEIHSKITQAYNKHIIKFNKIIDHYQNRKIPSFLQSGVITKHIPSKFTTGLLESINEFANNSNIDYHPNSDNKVRDIIHPSLYPLLLQTKKSTKLMDYWKRPYEDSEFQWLPSEFEIDDKGKCKISSYINNLPTNQTTLYEQIEKLFEFVLPELEDIWSYINSAPLCFDDWIENTNVSDEFKKISLKNTTLQVITKVVTISLKSSDDLIGAWHIEGMPHENIIATASCTLHQDPYFKGTLSFKRIYTSKESEHIAYNIPQNPISEVEKLVTNTHVPLGKVNLAPNTLIAFPNSHVHKVDMFNIGSDKRSEQTRTIIVFWLINPNIKIKSTKDIKQQNYSLSLAHKNRLKLMKERSFHKQTLNQRDINLCEH